MDLQQAGGSAIQDYGDALTQLQNQDTQNRAFINARQDRYLRSTQQAPSDTVQTAATGTPDSGQLPASPDTSAPVAPQPAVSVTGRTTFAGPDSPVNGTPAQAATPTVGDIQGNQQVMAPNPAGAWAGRTAQPSTMDQLRAEQQRNDAYRNYAAQQSNFDALPAGQNPIPNIQEVLKASDAKLAALKQQAQGGTTAMASKTAQANPSYAGPNSSQTNTSATDAPTPYDPVIQSAAQSAGVDPTILKRLLGSESSFNPTAVSPRGAQYGYGIAQIAASHGLTQQQMEDPKVAIPFAANLLKQYADQNGGDMNKALLQYKGASSPGGIASMQPVVAKILTGLAPGSNAQAAQAPTQPATAQPAAPQGQPAQQGPKFTAADGTPFTVPQQYNDGQIQQMQQQAAQIKNAMQLAWLHYQNGTSPDNSEVMRLQLAGQQINQHLYNAEIYAKTQQAQGGNAQAFHDLLAEYSSKIQQPIQMVPVGNGIYKAVTPSGHLVAQGDPSTISGTFGGVLNSDARAMAMGLAQKKAEAYATESGKAEAGMPVEMAKLQTELAKQMGVNASDQIVAKIKTGELKVTTNINGQFLITDPATGKSTLLDPSKPNSIGAPTPYHQNLP